MATVLPAMRGTFGSTEYYLATMPAKELTERLVVPKNLEGWDDLTIEERYQRDINYNRVKKQIAPYLANDQDRFFGAFIVSMLHADNVEFEPLSSMVARLPNLYKVAGSAFGFLTLAGEEVLVPLDGQHRLAALDFAISGKDESQKPLIGIDANVDIAKDICTVILIKHDNLKSRKIFNKVNRYAKSTTKGENLITADDDVVAVIVRENIAGEFFPQRLIHYKSNTLSIRAGEFTTLNTLYEATKFLLEDLHGKINTQTYPSKSERQLLQSTACEFWQVACEQIDLLSKALHDESENGDEKRREIRRDYVIGKPVAQLALVQSIVRLRAADSETGVRLSMEEACERVNSLCWTFEEPIWQGVLLNGDRVVSGKTAVAFAGRVISYLLGEKLSQEEETELRDRFKDLTGNEGPGRPFF